HHRSPLPQKIMALLKQMGLPDAHRVYAAYPHQLSGGQRQRIVIAQALACEPALVVADEPTASLDPVTASQIIELLGQHQQRLHTAFLFISHDLVPLARLADRIIVMYAGRIVEQGSRADVLERPLHPYTKALLACALEQETLSDTAEVKMEALVEERPAGKRLIPTIPGRAPDPMDDIAGCDFESRCPDRMEICRTRFPGETRPEANRTVHCFKYGG
ncbi:MAG: oligopeptide/dipeptide ABC transporter ATP-binding protein, partial [Mycobacterium sp.]